MSWFFKNFQRSFVTIGFLLLISIELVFQILHETGNLTDESRLQSDMVSLHQKYLHVLNPNAQTNFKYRRAHMDVPIEINAYGYRDPHMTKNKKKDVFRIAAMGDSVTFGWEVLEANTFPRILESKLKKYQTKVEVLNFGVPGHTSFSGKQILEDEILNFKPNLLLIGYGFNDWKYGVRSAEETLELIRNTEKNSPNGLKRFKQIRKVLRSSRVIGVLDHHLQKKLHRKRSPEDFSKYKHAVSPERYRENILAMIQTAKKHGIAVILLNTSFSNNYTRDVLEDLAESAQVPFLDLRKEFQSDPVTLPRLDLPDPNKNTHMLFRVFVPSHFRESVNEHGLTLLGNHEKLGNYQPGQVYLNDEGEDGDQVAGDHIWSVQLEMNLENHPNSFLEYSFIAVSPAENRLSGEPVAMIRSFLYYFEASTKTILQSETWTSPVHVLGFSAYSPMLLAGTDFVHTNRFGNTRIAEIIEHEIISKWPHLEPSTLATVESITH